MQRSYTHCTTFPDQQGNNLTVRYTADIERSHRLLESAFVWAAESVSCVPAQPGSKAVLFPWKKFQTELPTDDQFYHWFSSGRMNIAVVCSSGNLEVLDFDQAEQYAAWKEKAGPLATSYTERTPRGGAHVFFQVDQPITRAFRECESFGPGHLANVWPSVVNGAVYSPVDPLAPIIRAEIGEIFSLLSEKPESTRPAWPAEPHRVKPAGNDLVSRIKAALPVLHLAESLISDLTPSGGNGRYWVGTCPFHSDDHPSFWIDSEKNLYGCFQPDCKANKTGDVLNLYSLAHQVTIQQAVKLLAAELLK